MSLTHSLVVAANDMPAVQDAVATVAGEVLGKGGFSAVPTLGQIAEFQLTGLLVVFTVLGGLTLMCVLLAWILKTVAPDQFHCRKKGATPVAPKAPAAPSAPTASAAPASIHTALPDAELIALLAVAASEAVGHAVSIVKFRHMDSMDWTWSVQGRVGHHSSHKL